VEELGCAPSDPRRSGIAQLALAPEPPRDANRCNAIIDCGSDIVVAIADHPTLLQIDVARGIDRPP
jgi:hypothetical protein